MNRSFFSRYIPLAIILIACIFMLLPVLHPGFLMTDDGEWMVVRLSAFYQSLREGQFPVRFLGRLNHSYGYPVSNFLYPGYLYIGSILHGMGFTFQAAVEAIVVASVIGSAYVLYVWLQHFFNKPASLLGAISYVFMPYLLYDVYKRGSVGEILAMGTCILVLYAIEEKKGWLLAPSMALLAISHNTLALFFVPVLFGYICVKRYWNLLFPMCIGIGVSLFFWLPAIFEKPMVFFDQVIVSEPIKYFPISLRLVLRGSPFLIAGMIGYFMRRRERIYQKEMVYFLLLLAGSSVAASGLVSFIWRSPLIMQGVQFPYRFLALGCFAGPWFISLLANNKKNIIGTICSVIFVLVLLGMSLPYQKSEMLTRPEGFFTTNEGTTTVANEYMPKWVSVLPVERAPTRLEFYKGNAKIDEIKVTTEIIDISIHAQEDSVLQVNTIFYPGWGAMLDNKPISIHHDNPMGVMRLMIPSGTHRLYMAFRETASRFVADILSVLSIVICIIWFMRPKHMKRIS